MTARHTYWYAFPPHEWAEQMWRWDMERGSSSSLAPATPSIRNQSPATDTDRHLDDLRTPVFCFCFCFPIPSSAKFKGKTKCISSAYYYRRPNAQLDHTRLSHFLAMRLSLLSSQALSQGACAHVRTPEDRRSRAFDDPGVTTSV
ncbi:hypothetical protein HETIRDRAFT_448189 [Heterobasidion irregulare TC 32-1]|uniref:Uncharacterized protein n=1 Tax=Heterobasidion irregulare (strain TC 32-1) TaxID=747525 RepID=W4KRQ0_HETIT|nr:uncharacterized protein HETIRDRAFT_448189 [Heterobasidion irregulare TC 32-1]ETW87746.1 hypothetical protein HETIRDRAFT_448189 [Heterobasidion irregulare TC 32-1]